MNEVRDFKTELEQELLQSVKEGIQKGLLHICDEEIERIIKAYEYAFEMHASCKPRKSGEPYIIHPVAVAKILIELRADANTIIAGLLHDVVEDVKEVEISDIVDNFGWRVANIVDGVTKIKKTTVGIDELNHPTIRKLLVSASSDIRTILVKLSDRLHNMRTLQYMSRDKQLKIARETLEVYVPLAQTIGANRIKKELEDLSVQYLDPLYYAQLQSEVRSIIDNDYKDSVLEAQAHLTEIFSQFNLNAQILYREENIGNIYLNLKKDPIFDHIKNLISLKILLKKAGECYTALGLINTNYRAETVVKDYITNPKPNGYQSIHTRIFLPKPTLVKIRTEEHDKIATYGITAEMYQMDDLFRVISCLKETNANDKQFLEALKDQINEQKIYVYAEDGVIVEVPKGSTVVDFAYKLNNEIGDSLYRAFVNGNMVSLDYTLENFDYVVIQRDFNKSNSNLEWLNYAKTPYARSRINKAKRID